jgi:acylphosphatase
MPVVHLRIVGRVQGVGFRYALQHEAERLGITGWVRNRADGSVEALAQGPQEALDALEAWARRGPPAARVSEVTPTAPTAEGERSYEAFVIGPSV